MSISYSEAVDRLQQVAQQLATRLECVRVQLDGDALGRTSAKDVYGDKTLPPFDNSAMDGFAVTSSSTLTASEEEPVRFKVLGSIAAGDDPPTYDLQDQSNLDSSCFIINTGAPFPLPSTSEPSLPGPSSCTPHFDACLRKEDAILSPDGSHVECLRPVRARMHRRSAGEDFRPGTQLLRRGDRITAERVAALASNGIETLEVLRHPKVAVLSTGKELEPLDAHVKAAAHIHDSNSHYIVSALRQWGYNKDHNIHRLGKSLGDDPMEFRRAIQKCIDGQYDVLITTGGVSKGQHDYIKETLLKVGAKIHFHGVRMRPGHPALLATIEGQAGQSKPLTVFSLPGNPCAAAATLRFLVEPFLRRAIRPQPSAEDKLQRQAFTLKACLLDDHPPKASAKGGVATGCGHGHTDHRSYLLGRFAGHSEEGLPLVLPLPRGSGMVRPLSEADCWVLVEESQTNPVVSCFPMSGPLQ